MALLINKEGILVVGDSSTNEIYLRIKYIGDLPGNEIRCAYYAYLSKEKFTENYKTNRVYVDRIPQDYEFQYDPSANGVDVLDFVHQSSIDLLTNPIYDEIPKRDPSTHEIVRDPSTGDIVMENVLAKDAWLQVSEISIVDLD